MIVRAELHFYVFNDKTGEPVEPAVRVDLKWNDYSEVCDGDRALGELIHQLTNLRNKRRLEGPQ